MNRLTPSTCAPAGIGFAADAAAERGDQRADLRRRDHLVEARALDVEDLALQRQDGLRAPVASLFRGAAGRITLDDEDLAQRRILLLAVGKLAGQASDIERTLASRQLARLARSLARAGGIEDLADDGFRFLRMLEQEVAELVRNGRLHDTLHFGRDQLVLRL